MSIEEGRSEEFRPAFAMFDHNNDGRITADELAGTYEMLGQKRSPSEINLIVKEADLDGNGTIEFNEFVKMISARVHEESFEEELRATFRSYDVDQDGYISSRVLKDLLAQINPDVTEAAVAELVREVDSTFDGLIGEDQFIKMFQRV